MASAFTVTQSSLSFKNYGVGRSTSRFVSEDAGMGEPAQEDPAEPKPDVKCPDCDMCDGSGRCVHMMQFSFYFTLLRCFHSH